MYKTKWSKYVSIIVEATDKYSNIVYVKPGIPENGTFSVDKFHPNDAGHKIWFEAIKERI